MVSEKKNAEIAVQKILKRMHVRAQHTPVGHVVSADSGKELSFMTIDVSSLISLCKPINNIPHFAMKPDTIAGQVRAFN